MKDPEKAYEYAREAHHALDQVLAALGEGAEQDAHRYAMKRALRATFAVQVDAEEEVDGDPSREDAFEREWDPRDEVPA